MRFVDDVRGFHEHANNDPTQASLQRAAELCDQATRLLPFNSEAQNANLVMKTRLATESARNIADGFISALTSNPRNQSTLSNLRNFYRLIAASNPSWRGERLPPDELQERLRLADAVSITASPPNPR